MKKNLFITAIVTLLVVAAAGPPSGPRQASADTTTAVLDILAISLAMLDAIPEPLDDPLDPPGFFQVKPQEFDPGKTNLVQAAWLNGIGCPTNATIALPNASFSVPPRARPSPSVIAVFTRSEEGRSTCTSSSGWIDLGDLNTFLSWVNNAGQPGGAPTSTVFGAVGATAVMETGGRWR